LPASGLPAHVPRKSIPSTLDRGGWKPPCRLEGGVTHRKQVPSSTPRPPGRRRYPSKTSSLFHPQTAWKAALPLEELTIFSMLANSEASSQVGPFSLQEEGKKKNAIFVKNLNPRIKLTYI
jgi:hypothetical protein